MVSKGSQSQGAVAEAGTLSGHPPQAQAPWAKLGLETKEFFLALTLAEAFRFIGSSSSLVSGQRNQEGFFVLRPCVAVWLTLSTTGSTQCYQVSLGGEEFEMAYSSKRAILRDWPSQVLYLLWLRQKPQSVAAWGGQQRGL